MNEKKKKSCNKGFSLIELIIVIAIMTILVGVLAPQYLKHVHNARLSTDLTNAQEMATAINVAVADGSITGISTDTTVTGTDLATLMSKTAASVPVSKLGGSFSVTYNSVDGVTKITLTGVDNGANPKVSSFELYPDPDNTTDGANGAYSGKGLKK